MLSIKPCFAAQLVCVAAELMFLGHLDFFHKHAKKQQLNLKTLAHP